MSTSTQLVDGLDGRVAWMLRVNRVLGPDSQWAQAKRFAAAFRGGTWKRAVSDSSVSRWETGSTRPSRAAITRYEEILELDPGEITATVDTLRRYLTPAGGAADPTAGTRPSGSPGAWTGPDDGARDLDDLIERAVGDTLMTGAHWDRLTWLVTRSPNLVIAPRATRGAITERLVSEMIVAHGRAWRQRFESLNRVLGNPTLAQDAVAACASLGADRTNQIFIEVIGALDGTRHPDAAKHVLAQLTHPTNERALRGALLASLRKVAFGHFSPAQLKALRPRIDELLRDSLFRADALPVAAALRLPRPGLGGGREAALADPAATAEAGHRHPRSASSLTQRVFDRTTERLDREPLSPGRDVVLHDLIRELLLHPVSDHRLYAAMFLASTPYRRPLAAALAAELRPTAVDLVETNLRLFAALRALGDAAQRPVVERTVTAPNVPAAAVNAATFTIGHLHGASEPAFWQGALDHHARRWRASRDQGSAAALTGLVYSLGIAGQRRALAAIHQDPDSPVPGRTAARWWLNLPNHIYESARH